MSKHVQHVPKHRATTVRSPLGAPRRGVRTAVVLSSVAAVATAVTVAGGVVGADGPGTARAAVAQRPADDLLLDDATPDDGAPADVPSAASSPEAASEAASEGVAPPQLGEREPVVSRSDRRAVADPEKEEALAADDAPAMTASETLADDDPRDVARALLGEFGFSSAEFGCLDSLWTKESGWNVYADNPSSSAYGIPQSLPGSKMASAGSDWADNPATQIRWGLGYIQDRYGTPCSAWSHSQANNWY